MLLWRGKGIMKSFSRSLNFSQRILIRQLLFLLNCFIIICQILYNFFHILLWSSLKFNFWSLFFLRSFCLQIGLFKHSIHCSLNCVVELIAISNLASTAFYIILEFIKQNFHDQSQSLYIFQQYFILTFRINKYILLNLPTF